jgi:hypothetical protein
MSREVGGRSFIDPRIKSIAIGSLLGDAYVYPNGTMQIDHSWTQRDYVEWKYSSLSEVAGKPPRRVERVDRRNNKTYFSMRFYTRAVFGLERALVYPEGSKRVPAGIVELLDPLALSVWYMDDGGRGGRTPLGMVWNVSSYRAQDRELLREALLDRYGVATTLQRAGTGTHLYIRAQSAAVFVEIVRPFLIPSMLYKLPLDPVTTETNVSARPLPNGKSIGVANAGPSQRLRGGGIVWTCAKSAGLSGGVGLSPATSATPVLSCQRVMPGTLRRLPA